MTPNINKNIDCIPKDYIRVTNVHDADKYNDNYREEAARQKKIEQAGQRREAVKGFLNYNSL